MPVLCVDDFENKIICIYIHILIFLCRKCLLQQKNVKEMKMVGVASASSSSNIRRNELPLKTRFYFIQIVNAQNCTSLFFNGKRNIIDATLELIKHIFFFESN